MANLDEAFENLFESLEAYVTWEPEDDEFEESEEAEGGFEKIKQELRENLDGYLTSFLKEKGLLR